MKSGIKPSWVMGLMVASVVCLGASQPAFGEVIVALGSRCAGPDIATSTLIAIASGPERGVAIKADGVLVTWGRDHYDLLVVPSENNFIAVAAGDYHSLALDADGVAVAWGRDNYGQCNVPAGDDFTAVAAGRYHSLALKGDGSIVAWGYNGSGECDVPAGN
ncbi:MAG: hypothetical protein KAV82_04870, partial [Phycisphaerae bacterium]|nr:hypothetical protein [Phycisphaerae bacterium]